MARRCSTLTGDTSARNIPFKSFRPRQASSLEPRGNLKLLPYNILEMRRVSLFVSYGIKNTQLELFLAAAISSMSDATLDVLDAALPLPSLSFEGF